MISLLLDSSTNRLSLALAQNDKVIDFIDEPAFQTQSEQLVFAINKLLTKNNLKPNDVAAIVVGYGPGSYTGVRISVTVAKTWAYAKNIKLYAVSSLGIYKHESRTTICLKDARNDRSFVGIYKQKEVILEDTNMANEDIRKLITKDYVLAGDTKAFGVESSSYNIFANMLSLANETTLVKDIMGFKPVYLKGE